MAGDAGFNVDEGVKNVLQTTLHYSRQRVLSFRDLTAGLSQTHQISIGDNSIQAGDLFPIKTSPVTFTFKIRIGANTPVGGTIVTLGQTDIFTLAIAAGVLSVSAGDISASPINGSDSARPARDTVDAVLQYVVAINPGQGKIIVWENGVAVIAVQGVLQPFWADQGNIGEFGVSQTDIAVIEPLRVFNKQVPRHFLNTVTAGGGGD